MKAVFADNPEDRGQISTLAEAHVDITGAELVQVQRSAAGDVLWVNVNGVCVLRVCRIKNFVFNEE